MRKDKLNITCMPTLICNTQKKFKLLILMRKQKDSSKLSVIYSYCDNLKSQSILIIVERIGILNFRDVMLTNIRQEYIGVM